MQSVHSIWSGRTFALPAAAATSCGDKKKTRGRRSKEERKAMVESFIKKYQNLNNGKFPSLNLTHKEVGGSFYTVREIVREIIQQNRVLGPGYPTSKALNLEYLPEEQTTESFSMNISSPLSMSTIKDAIDQQQGESLSLCKESRKTKPEIIEADESVNQECHDFQPNDAFVSQFLNDGNSNDTYLDNKSEDLSREPDLSKLSEVMDGNSGFCEHSHADVQVYSAEYLAKGEHPDPLCESVAMAPSLSESVMNGYDNADKSNGVTVAINLPAASSSLPVTDSFSEADISLGRGSYCTSCGGDDSLASTHAKTCNPGKSQNDVDVITYVEVPKPRDSDEVRVAFVPFEKDSVINMSETTETLSSSEVNRASAACTGELLSLENDSIINSSEAIKTLPSIAIDDVSNESLSGSASQNFESPTLHSTSSMAQPLFQASKSENVVTHIGSSSGESFQPINPEPERALSNIASARKSSSISQDEAGKESAASERNPVWAAIKSFLNAVVKFWTE